MAGRWLLACALGLTMMTGCRPDAGDRDGNGQPGTRLDQGDEAPASEGERSVQPEGRGPVVVPPEVESEPDLAVKPPPIASENDMVEQPPKVEPERPRPAPLAEERQL